MKELYINASDYAKSFITHLPKLCRQFDRVKCKYIEDRQEETNYAYAALILDQLAMEYDLSASFVLRGGFLFTKKSEVTVILRNVMCGWADFFITINCENCRPIHIQFKHNIEHGGFEKIEYNSICGEWANNIDKIKHELKKASLIKIVET